MKLLGGSKQTIDKDKKNENVQRNELTELILKPCNVVDNKYQRNAIFFFYFVLHKAFGQRITASPQSLIFSETFKSFKYIEVQFPDQNNQILKIEHKVNLTLVIY